MTHVEGGGLTGNQAQQFRDGPKGNFFKASGHTRAASAQNLANYPTNANSLAGTNPSTGPPPGPPSVSQNVRIRLPDYDDNDDDMSDGDPEAEAAEEDMERMRIKHQAQMRRSKQKFVS